jgi:hypothetical protein
MGTGEQGNWGTGEQIVIILFLPRFIFNQIYTPYFHFFGVLGFCEIGQIWHIPDFQPWYARAVPGPRIHAEC